MDDRTKRELLRYFIQIQSQNIKPTFRNIGLGHLIRIFDEARGNELEAFIPNDLLKHIELIEQAEYAGNIHLWSITFAQKIASIFINQLSGKLREDMTKALGVERIHQMRQICVDHQVPPNEVEQCICRGFASGIFQYLYQKVPTALLQKANYFLNEIDYLDTDAMNVRRKACLIKNLKLDGENPEHLAFWEKHTYLGFFKAGGVKVQCGKQTYRIPHRIDAMMRFHKTHFGSFSDLKDWFADLRTTPLGYFPWLKEKCRDDVTKAVYKASDLDLINVEQIESLQEVDTQQDQKIPQSIQSYK